MGFRFEILSLTGFGRMAHFLISLRTTANEQMLNVIIHTRTLMSTGFLKPPYWLMSVQSLPEEL